MKGSGFSLWPTARASEQENRTTRSAPSHGSTHGEVLAGVAGDFMQNWPTPVGQDASGARTFSIDGKTRLRANAGLTLTDSAKMWTTPQAHDVTMRGAGQKPTAKAGNACLARDAANWPTPAAAQDTKGAQATAEAALDREGRGKQLALADRALLFTRPGHPTQTHGVTFSQLLRIWRPLRASVIAFHGRATWRRLWKGRSNKRLNPPFVEWLMGWPPGHALCACSVMEFIHWQQDMRSALYSLPTASAAWIWQPPAETETETLPTYEDVSLF